MKVDAALLSRRSVRKFLPEPVPEDLVRRLLSVAARAPSGTNMQPWGAYVTTGHTKERLYQAVIGAVQNGATPQPEYPYYPERFREPYVSRRRKVGYDLYGLLGIAKGDKEGMARQFRRNFRFFDAPVGIIFTLDKDLALGSWLDHGIFLGCFMAAARGEGLDTCPQAVWVDYHRAIRTVLPIPDGEAIVCGMALGYADERAPENALQTAREPIDGWARFFGWQG